jgi:3-phenylpropionate/trans-cinnamate dioxygenase ferredoxin component
MAWVEVAKVGDIPDGEGRQVTAGGHTIGVFNCAGTFRAVADRCTHARAFLHEGSVDRRRCTVECPLHGAEFDLASGEPLSPPATVAVQVYAVEVRGRVILVEIPDTGEGPAAPA